MPTAPVVREVSIPESIAVAELAPSMVLAPFAGAVADRVNRLNGLRVTQVLAMVQALALEFARFTPRAFVVRLTQ